LVKIIVPICEIITCNRCVLTNNGYKLCFSGKSQIKYQIDLFILKKKLVYLKKRESILKLNKNDKLFSYHNFFFSNISPLKNVILLFTLREKKKKMRERIHKVFFLYIYIVLSIIRLLFTFKKF
jgi:hypothetical protein